MPKIINILLILVSSLTINCASKLPQGFVYVADEIPSIELEMRYFGTNNFVGAKVDGYEAEKCILSIAATNALRKVQEELRTKGLGIKIYDAYRPQRAVDHFRRWARNLKDTLNKQQFYPDVAKKDLFKLEYIATKSRHSSGSTVDITIIDLTTKEELDMGSSYDFFGKISWVNYKGLTAKQLENRQLLQRMMLKHGFRNYPQEWWHFTLRGEPFKNQYFDFPIQ
ncbi:M15 family metallopeptidase [uncultured Kordia sp.]|uniref:M15 family metallopeptidase n=1 Tax=uncultured Kordia sp. TaxID=507699 RepID=UPI002623DD53|nr:M15 family metallopeptidase [uncultured Kordia sp.]